ncbi:unnamed protein product [Closterium sp. NIES-54]
MKRLFSFLPHLLGFCKTVFRIRNLARPPMQPPSLYAIQISSPASLLPLPIIHVTTPALRIVQWWYQISREKCPSARMHSPPPMPLLLPSSPPLSVISPTAFAAIWLSGGILAISGTALRDGTAAALNITQLGGPVAQWWDVGDIRDGHACIPSAHVPPAVPPLSLSQLSGPVAQWWDVGDIRDGHACIPSAHVPPAVPPLSLSQLSGPVAQWWDVGDIRALRMQWCYQWLPQLLCSQLSPLPLALLAIIHPTGPYLSG